MSNAIWPKPGPSWVQARPEKIDPIHRKFNMNEIICVLMFRLIEKLIKFFTNITLIIILVDECVVDELLNNTNSRIQFRLLW